MTTDSPERRSTAWRRDTSGSLNTRIEEGRLKPTTTARSVLGEDLPLIDNEVTVEQLLAHRSGIGDYFDEEADRPITDYVLAVPVHELATTEPYTRVLDGYPSKFPPGERFSYCNGGYVVLALIAERSSGTPFHELVAQRVCRPAGMRDTHFVPPSPHLGYGGCRAEPVPSRSNLGGQTAGLDDGDGQIAARRLPQKRVDGRGLGT